MVDQAVYKWDLTTGEACTIPHAERFQKVAAVLPDGLHVIAHEKILAQFDFAVDVVKVD